MRWTMNSHATKAVMIPVVWSSCSLAEIGPSSASSILECLQPELFTARPAGGANRGLHWPTSMYLQRALRFSAFLSGIILMNHTDIQSTMEKETHSAVDPSLHIML